MYKGTILKSTANEIGTMLNSKLGVNTGFKPSEWAGAINLLAKCPEKTVSGSIVNIEDGAKDVPLKNCICAIPASLTGTTSVEVVQVTANLFDGVFEDGWIANDGSETPTAGRIRSKNYLPCKPSTSYYLMCEYSTYRIAWYDKEKNFISHQAAHAVTSPSNAFYFRLATPTTSVSYFCLNYPSSVTTQQPYSTNVSKAVSLGQTVYGGSVDVVTGDVTKSWERKLGSEFQLWQKHNSGYFYCIASYTGKASGQENVMCDGLSTTTTAQMTTTDYSISGRTQDGAIYVRLTGTETLEEFQTWIADKNIAYELETPVTVQITPIQMSTFEGVNTIFNRSGDTSVTYRRDPNLALAQYENAPLLFMSNNEEREVEEYGNDISE